MFIKKIKGDSKFLGGNVDQIILTKRMRFQKIGQNQLSWIFAKKKKYIEKDCPDYQNISSMSYVR